MASFGWAAERFGRRAAFIATFLAAFVTTVFAYWHMAKPDGRLLDDAGDVLCL
ncbi:MAG: hypothetical protein U1E93_03310 [Alphaproteobacteria bacterium]